MKKSWLSYTLFALVALLMLACEPLVKPSNTFSVVFDANGGIGSMDMEVYSAYYKGYEEKLPENTFTREGYVFTGWNTAPDGSGTAYTNEQAITISQNLKLYAQWDRMSVALFFDANGGSGNMDVQFLKYDLAGTLNENTFMRGGYVFTGWNTKPDGSGTSYKDKSEITIKEETSIYAQWKRLVSGTENGYSYIDLGLPSELKWSISNVGAGIPEGTGDYFAWGETEPKKEYSWDTYKWCVYGNSAYMMTKYNTDSHYGTVVDNKEFLDIEDDAAHANMGDKWRMPTGNEYVELLNHCTWTWASQNGINGYIVKSKTNGNSMFLPAAGWKYKTGSESVSKWGFYWLNSLTTSISPANAYYWKFYSEPYKYQYDHHDYTGRYYGMTIRAVYAEFAIITFNANGGEGEMPAQKMAIGESQALMSNAFTRAGYNFTGWNTAPDGSGTAYAEHQIINPQQNLTLYAQWKREPVVVTFDANGGSGSMEPQLFDPEVLQALPANTFTRDGHMFTGWNTAPDGSGTSFNDQAEVMIGGSLTLYAQWCAVSGFENEHAYVDLGLPSGTKWATCNLGATAPEGYGDYFAWGETAPKSNYEWISYKYCNGSGTTLTKYNTKSDYGTVDNKTTLDLSDDAARANWGGKWRMPTKVEQDELSNNCTWTWSTQNGVNGYKVTSKTNGNSIFLPAAGYRNGTSVHDVGSYGRCWSSSLYESYPSNACRLVFNSGNVGWNNLLRYFGHSVRAVISDDAPQATIYTLTFNANGGSGTMAAQTFESGVSQAIAANAFTRSGYNFTGWNTSPDGSGNSYTDKQSIVLTQDMTLYAQWEQEQVVSGTENGYAYVDLDLPSGTKWATCNVGATTPEGYGDYFAWGETEPKDNYKWSTYKYCNGSETTLTKYNTNSSRGTVDNKTTLDLSDDAARANWGGKWRMPTEAEQDELRNNCTWTWTTRNGINGYKVTSKTNGNSIFLPAAVNRLGASVGSVGSGGDYWSSSLDESSPSYACSLYFKSGYVAWSTSGRYGGHTVRAVISDDTPQTTIYTLTFNANGGSGTMAAQTFESGVSQAIAANAFTRSGYNFIGWNSNADGSGTSYTDKQSITLTQDVTLYAQWERIKYNLSFDANGGEGTMAAQVFEAGVSQAIVSNTFTREGYDFIGWSSNADGSGTSYSDKQVISIANDLTLYAQWGHVENGHEWVDLGLPSGLKWATCNVGATTPEGYGDYFAWGETKPKEDYSWNNYSYCKGSHTTLTKYNTNNGYGTVDNKTTLDLSDDAANVNWGGTWRMPTRTEQEELRNSSYCTWMWTTQNGVKGLKVTSKTNGNSIFLPAAGYHSGINLYNVGSHGYYRTSSLVEDNPSSTHGLYFYTSDVGWSYYGRNEGLSVRAVCP